MTGSDQIGQPRRRRGQQVVRSESIGGYRAAAVVSVLLVVFATLSYSAILGKSATYDEPLHVVGGQVHRYLRDYRINPEDPALFGWWSSLPHGKTSMALNPTDEHFKAAINDMDQQWYFVVSTLYRNGARAADDFLNQSRFMFVLLGVALGGLIALWAYQIGGAVAAIGAAILFSFDPNMLAHAALVKNDVPLSLLMCAVGFCIWKLGAIRGGHWIFLPLAWLASGLALNVKFSAVLLFPMLGLLLLIRAIMPAIWSIGPFTVRSIRNKLLSAVAAFAMALVVAWIVTWTVYGFRYSATTSGQPINVAPIERRAISNRLEVDIEGQNIPQMSPAELHDHVEQAMAAEDFALPIRADLWMQSHHILPEGWLFGFLYTYTTTLVRSAFLLGTIRLTGCWYYFPAAMMFKTPTAILLAVAIAPLVAISVFIKSKYRAAESEQSEVILNRLQSLTTYWTIAVLTLPPAIYFCTALCTNLNLGLRHILPVYPFLYISLGWIFSKLWMQRRLPAIVLGAIISLGLISETVAAYPDYLPFFNTPSGGARGGLRLLGDSNLDWGQDLPALVRWQHEHPADRLYLCYFGMANPTQYGLDFVNLPGGYPLSPYSNLSDQPGVVAVSATNVQGIYLGKQLTEAYKTTLQHEQPFEVLDGTIYLYHWPPRHD